jgi:cell division protease FtsH
MYCVLLYCLINFPPFACGIKSSPTKWRGHHQHHLLRMVKYPISRNYYEEALKRLNNDTMRDIGILTNNEETIVEQTEESVIIIHHISNQTTTINEDMRQNHRNHAFQRMMERYENQQKDNERKTGEKSENFEVIYGDTNGIKFSDIGGFETIKGEMLQCVDMLKNWEKYSRFSVRTPKGLVLEGPPGNGKTMLAKGFATEADVAFIAVSGAEFQDKYIGVGSSKIRELFTLACENRPCVIFIDEIDALGRKRNDGDSGGNAERDNTLNQLLVEMDGFRNNSGIFVIGATNRADLLDSALMRPGRIDKRIYVGMPDNVARRFIIDIHMRGKPNQLQKGEIEELVSMTSGFSGAQIENLLNEAMLFALKNDKEEFNMSDIDTIYNRVLGGMQSEEHNVSDEMLERICVHELGHSLMGLFCKHHPLMKKVVINLTSPKNPGMTIFEDDEMQDRLNTYEALFERISILYGGRIAELLIYGETMISTGATTDFAEARVIAQKMVVDYGMGQELYSGMGEKSKDKLDIEVENILSDAYAYTYGFLEKNKDCIISGSAILKRERSLSRRDLQTYLML